MRMGGSEMGVAPSPRPRRAIPKPVQTALVPGQSAGAYAQPDHTPGEQWPGRQPPTKQLSLFETALLARAKDANAPHAARAPRPPPRPQKQTSMVRFMYIQTTPDDEPDDPC